MILLTRAVEYNQPLATILAIKGLDFFQEPLLYFTYDYKALEQASFNLTDKRPILVTSKIAALMLRKYRDKCGAVYAVGIKTGSIIAADYVFEDINMCIPHLPCNTIYFCADEITQELGLSKVIIYYTSYTKEFSNDFLKCASQMRQIVIYSSNTGRCFLRLAMEHGIIHLVRDACYVCISHKVATLFLEHGFKAIWPDKKEGWAIEELLFKLNFV